MVTQLANAVLALHRLMDSTSIGAEKVTDMVDLDVTNPTPKVLVDEECVSLSTI